MITMKTIFDDECKKTEQYKIFGRYAFYAEVCFQYGVYDQCASYIKSALINCVYYVAKKTQNDNTKFRDEQWLKSKLENDNFKNIFGEEQVSTAKEILSACKKIQGVDDFHPSIETLRSLLSIIRQISKQARTASFGFVEIDDYESLIPDSKNFSKFNRNTRDYSRYGHYVEKAYFYLQKDDFDSCAFNIRKALDKYVDFLYQKHNIPLLPKVTQDKDGFTKYTTLSDRINNDDFQKVIPEADITLAHIIRMKGNSGVHVEADGKQIEKAYSVLLALLLNQSSELLIDMKHLSTLPKAIFKGDLEKVKHALGDKRVKIDPVAFDYAIRCDNLDIIKLLEEQGLSDDFPVHKASMYNSPESLKYFIKKNYKLNNLAGENGGILHDKTPLMIAAMFDSSTCASILLRNRADVKKKNSEGKTALHYAAEFDSPQTAEILISNNAPLDKSSLNNSKKFYNRSILKACLNTRNNFLASLIIDVAGVDILHGMSLHDDAIATDNVAFLSLLYEKKIFDMEEDIKTTGNGNLFTAIRYNSLCVAKYFIQNGYDVNKGFPSEEEMMKMFQISYPQNEKKFEKDLESARRRDESMREIISITPLMAASRTNNMDAINLLLANGADVNIKDKYGRTFLMFLVRFCDEEIIYSVIEKNPDIISDGNTKEEIIYQAYLDYEKLTLPLTEKADYKNNGNDFLWKIWNSKTEEEVINYKNFMPNVKGTISNHKGWTPLHFCAMKNYIMLGEKLLNAGALPNAQSEKDAITPLMIAAYNNHFQFMEKLLNYGANIHIMDNNGSNALVSALEGGSVESAIILLNAGIGLEKLQDVLCDEFSAYTEDKHKKVISTCIYYAIVENKMPFITALLEKNSFDYSVPIVNSWITSYEKLVESNILNETYLEENVFSKLDTTSNSEEIYRYSVILNRPELADRLYALGWKLNYYDKYVATLEIIKKKPSILLLVLLEILHLGIFIPEKLEDEFLELYGKTGSYSKDAYFAPPYIAVARQNYQMIKWFIDHGFDVNTRFIQSNNGEPAYEITVIYQAILSGNLEIVKLLVESGADLKTSLRNGMTPAKYAEHFEKNDIVIFLKEYMQKHEIS